MSSLILFLSFVYVLSPIKTIYAFNKSISLNNDNLGASGIGVIITANHVNTTNNIWHINPSTQDGTDIQLQMNSEWGFHPTTQSTIYLTIDGFTPNITKSDGEFLILFGVTNYYFSIVIRLEDKTAWKSYPDSNSTHSLAYTNNIFMDLILTTQSIENRWNRISNNDQWTNIGHPQLYKKGLKWPLKVSITNDPIKNKVYYQCYLQDRVLTAEYNSAFPVDEGLSVYIMNDASDGKPFDIYSIDVTYSYMTHSPTMTPSITPTQQPSVPTLTPTLSPTNRVLIVPGNGDDNDGDLEPDTNDENVNNGVSTTKDPFLKDDNDREGVVIIDDNDDTLYVIVIIVLGVLLCIVSIVLIYKWLNGTYLKSKPENDKVNERVKSPKLPISPKSISSMNSINKYIQKQLAESIANSSGVDSPDRGNSKKPFVIIPGARPASAGSNGSKSTSRSSTTDSDDSDEELYEQGSMDTETTTFTNGYRADSRRNILSDLNIVSMSVIDDGDNEDDNSKGNEGTPDEILNIDIDGRDKETENMNENELENETIALPMNAVTYV